MRYIKDALKDFQFTPLREGRSSTGNPAVQCQYFNSRPSARGDLRHKRRRAGGQFQFTPLREGRRPPFAYPPVQAHFNSRPSARGDNSAAERPEARPANFNSRPSARGDGTGANPGAEADAFQFTPLREGRLAKMFKIAKEEHDFNSRPSARGDRRRAADNRSASPISIHAPPRGATRRKKRRGTHCLFQFTPLREGRQPEGIKQCVTYLYFNSRPSARGDGAEN